MFFLGGGVNCELLTISWADSGCGEVQLKTPISRGILTSLGEIKREKKLKKDTLKMVLHNFSNKLTKNKYTIGLKLVFKIYLT